VLSRPIAVAVATLLAGLAFTGARLSHFDGDASRFVVAGDAFTDRSAVPGGIAVINDSTGYDGQYFYRLALDPLTDRRTDHGITFVSPAYNQQRIGYPILAWVASLGGRPGLLPVAMIAVNLLALAALALGAAALARQLGRPPVWGLSLALYPGIWVSLGRNLTEVVAAAALVGGMVHWRRGRSGWAGALFALAALARETTLVAPLALAAVTVLSQRKRPPAAAVIPLVTAGLWQVFLLARWGTTGPGAAGDASLVAPLRGVFYGVRYHARTGDWVALSLAVGLVAAVAVFALAAAGSGRALPYERIAFVVAAAVLLCASRFVWAFEPGFLRAGTEAWMLGGAALLGSTGLTTARRDWAVGTGVASAAVALVYVTTI
jgi:hypothetical protein